MFFFKQNKIVVDAFVNNSAIQELFPIEKSSNHLPEWWKSFPSTYQTYSNGLNIPHGTIKRCDGIIDYFKNGFTIPLWCDLMVKTDANGNIAAKYSDSNNLLPPLGGHPKQQTSDEFDKFIHLKLLSPWLLSEKTGINWYMGQAFWNQTKYLQDIYTPPGILNFKYQNTTHINFFIPKKESELVLPAGMPLVHMFPMTEKQVVIKQHEVSKEEYDKLFNRNKLHFKFYGKYKSNKKLVSDRESKCPFGFSK